MSVPSGNGYYATPPSSPPASSSGGCWKAAGITCGVLVSLGLIGGIAAYISIKNAIQHPAKNGIFSLGMNIGKATTDGLHLSRAVVQYHEKNNKYPKTLTDLVLDGETDGKILHNALDTNPSPGHISWRYRKPAEGAPGKTPILEMPYTISFVPNQPSQKGKITITLDGKTVPDTYPARG